MSKTVSSTEDRLPGLDGFDVWDNDRILQELLAGQYRAIAAVERALPLLSQAADAIAPRLAAGGKLFYAGAGTSIRIAVQDGSELSTTFGMPEQQLGYLIAGGRAAMFEPYADAEDDTSQGETDASVCAEHDALIAVAASGRTPYTVAAAKAAKNKGCLVISVVNNAGTPLAAAGDIEVLLATGPEVISGSTRMAAGTAQKVALNLLSTLVHTRLGAVHDGYMVNLEAGNAKLAKRAAKIVSSLAGTSLERAEAALDMANGHVKTAILLLSGAASPDQARQILSEARGNLRTALTKLKSQN